MGFWKDIFALQKDVGIANAKYGSFEISIWNIDGKVVAFLSNDENSRLKAFDRREIDLSEYNGVLPENFFDFDIERLKLQYRQEDFIGTVTDNDEKEDITDELLDLFGLREANHNLIYSTTMKSVKESDYYSHRECFPSEWEDTFVDKEYYFVISEDVGLRGKNDDGTEFTYENGYWQINSISALDAKVFYEEVICKNYDWFKDCDWEMGMQNLDCTYLFRKYTELEKMREPEIVKQFEDKYEKYLWGKKCFQQINTDDFV